MKILLSSYVFSPSVGGIETVSALLAPEFMKLGHEVHVITKTRGQDGIARPYEVHRDPGPLKMLQLFQWADVVLQSNISLRLAWPLVLIRRPWVIVHQTWLGPMDGRWEWKSQLKSRLLPFASNVAISRAVADALPCPTTIIGNPYSNYIFMRRDEVPRTTAMAYLGRLVSDKGVDLLIRALVPLKARGLTPRLTIIGSGSEEGALRRLIAELGLEGQVDMPGPITGDELAHTLNSLRVLVVPSQQPEPFGIVALEGIASGCMVVASRAGGLPDVVGPCGLTYTLGDVNALADALAEALTNEDGNRARLRHAPEHLESFKPANVARRYLEVLQQAVEKH
jgi:glycosyltransferase involved in cell wall biosynthesis